MVRLAVGVSTINYMVSYQSPGCFGGFVVFTNGPSLKRAPRFFALVAKLYLSRIS